MKLRSYLADKLRYYFDSILFYADATIDDPDDAENLHQFRVNSRRANSILKEFGECFDKTYLQKTKSTLNGFIKMSNEARDLDVFLQRLQKLRLPPGMELDELVSVLQRKRNHAYQTLFGDLAKVPAILYALKRPVMRGCKTGVKKALKNHFKSRVKKLKSLGTSIKTDEEFHALRIALKRVRYVAELMVERKIMKKSRLRRLKALQDLFGEIQDAAVETRKIFDLAHNNSFTPTTLLAMGKVAGDLIEHKEQLKQELKSRLKRELGKVV